MRLIVALAVSHFQRHLKSSKGRQSLKIFVTAMALDFGSKSLGNDRQGVNSSIVE